MSLEYSVKDVIRVLLKKWYLILGIGVLCGLLVTPMSRASYRKAQDAYEVATQDTEDIFIDLNIYIYIDGSIDKELGENLSEDILMLASELDNNLGLNKVYYKSINAIRISGNRIDKQKSDEFIRNLQENIDKILLAQLEERVEINFVDESVENETEQLANLIMELPTEKQIGGRQIIVAGIVGCLLGVFVVMVFDYIKCCKMIQKTGIN